MPHATGCEPHTLALRGASYPGAPSQRFRKGSGSPDVHCANLRVREFAVAAVTNRRPRGLKQRRSIAL